jgi:putative peptidoglycan lipid II flippase
VTESKNETVLENHSDARQRASYVFGVADEKTRAKAASEVMALLLPTAASVGVLQLAVLTDGLFASFEPGTAAAMGYANLLAMAPVGILSSAILLPVLPALSGLSNDPPAFWTAVSDSAVVALSASALLAAWLAGTARPLVEAAFMRAAFDGAAVAATTQLLVAYAAGTPFYLLRDVYARAFFALGDATTPFFVSLAAVALNVVFDWVAFFLLGLGGPGLVFATALINAASALLLAVALRRRRLSTASSVKQPTFTPELRALWRVGIAGSIAAIACHHVCSSLRSSLAPPTTLAALVGIAVGSLVCVAVFALACWATRFHDLRSIWQRYV